MLSKVGLNGPAGITKTTEVQNNGAPQSPKFKGGLQHDTLVKNSNEPGGCKPCLGCGKCFANK